MAVDFNGLLSGDDRLSVGGMTIPFKPKEFGFVTAAYVAPIGNGGTELTIDGYYAHSQPGGSLDDRDIEGRSSYAEAILAHPVVRSRDASLWLSGLFSILDSSQSEDGSRFRDDRINVAALSLYANIRLGKGRLTGRVSARQGLDILGASNAGDARLSRADGSGSFSKLEFWTSYDGRLGGPFSVGLQAQGQVASRPLLAFEEMGLGGRYFLRGYDYREYSGDRGIAGSAEIRFDLKELPRPFDSVQLYAFADAGSVGNYRGGAGSGSLASAGGGIRFYFDRKFEAGVEVGVPLRHGAIAGRDYDPRISVTATARF